MNLSPLQKARYQYSPKLPGMLRGGISEISVKVGAPTESVADQAKIKALFPNTYGKEEITFVKGSNTSAAKKQVVGVILSGHDGRRGFIHHMAVAESHRRQGIASALLDHALTALKEEGINKTALLVFKRNEAGNAFWETKGFTTRNDVAYRNKALAELIRIDT